ncbi:MAG: DHH family phosphoesterase, partial [Candidatus Adiutrix sp.]
MADNNGRGRGGPETAKNDNSLKTKAQSPKKSKLGLGEVALGESGQDSPPQKPLLKGSAPSGTVPYSLENSVPAVPKSQVKSLAATRNHIALGSQRLKALLNIFSRDDRVLIIISADPDAIASAVALKRILWRRVLHVAVAATNQVKRPDNLQLINTLNLKLLPIAELVTSSFSRLVVVDSQPHHSPLTENLHFDAIIDHHPPGLLKQD